MLKALVGGIGLLILLFTLVHSGGLASQHALNESSVNATNTSMDEGTADIGRVGTQIGAWAPYIIGIAAIVLVAVGGGARL